MKAMRLFMRAPNGLVQRLLRSRLMVPVLGAGVVLIVCGPASGAEAPAASSTVGELPAIRTLFETSFVINTILAGLSLVSVFLFMLFLLTINSQSLAPRSFVDEVTRLVVSGQYKEAADFCRQRRRTFAASIIQRAVENAGKDQSLMMVMIDSEGRRRAELIWGRVGYLAEIAAIAPMLGLLGTVWGMIKAFFAQEVEALSAGSVQLTNAIGGAMSTTLFGLLVAIMTLAFHAIIRSRATRGLAEVEQLVHSLADHIKRQDGGSAPRSGGSTAPMEEAGGGSILSSGESSTGRRGFDL